MMSKALKITAFTLEMIFSLVFLIFTIMCIVASIHNIKMTEDIKEFIGSSTFETKSGNNYYYSIDVDYIDSPTINLTTPENPILGNTGDIFLMPQSRMGMGVPLIGEFLSYYFGGHAGVITNEGYRLVEAMGGSASESFVYNFSNDLYTEERTVIGLRVKASLDERIQAAENAKKLIGKPYNYLFVLNTLDAYYCTDVCSRVYGKEFGMNYNIDTNGFHVSLQDLFRSEDTYITFVKYKTGNDTHIYYLK